MGGVQFGLELGLLALEQTGGDGLLGEAHLDQLVLAGFETPDQLGLGPLDLAHSVLAGGGQRPNRGLATLDPCWRHLHRGVVALDQVLKQLRSNVGSSRAGRAVDPAATEEVGVLATIAAGRDTERQAVAALAAVDTAAQVVLADARALPGDALPIEQRLHPLERLRVDQSIVPPVENLLVGCAAPVDELADVIGVAEQALYDGRAEFLGHPFGCRPGAQAEPVKFGGKLGDRVFAARIQLEREGDERPPVRVNGHDGDAPAVRQFIDAVEVAEGSRPIGAAHAGLLAQTALDVLGGLHRLKLVLGGDHALVEKGGGAVIADHRLGDGDERGPGLTHQLAGLPVVALIARPAAEAPDDDVIHMGRGMLIAALQLIKHFQKSSALVQINVGALAKIGKLAHNLGFELDGLFFGPLTLRVDAQAIVAVVGSDLALA